MTSLVSDLGIGVLVFASTNIDDIFILVAFFADASLRRRSIVIGQFLGIGALVLASALAAMLAFIVPPGWIALLGAVPLALGLRKLWSLRKDMQERAEDNRIQGQEHRAELRLHSQALAVAGVTIANGGDNIGVYVPLFASSVSGIATYAATFAVMTGLWCALGYAFVSNRVLGGPIRRYGHIALPIVLIALGLYILSGATTLVSL